MVQSSVDLSVRGNIFTRFLQTQISSDNVCLEWMSSFLSCRTSCFPADCWWETSDSGGSCFCHVTSWIWSVKSPVGAGLQVWSKELVRLQSTNRGWLFFDGEFMSVPLWCVQGTGHSLIRVQISCGFPRCHWFSFCFQCSLPALWTSSWNYMWALVQVLGLSPLISGLWCDLTNCVTADLWFLNKNSQVKLLLNLSRMQLIYLS